MKQRLQHFLVSWMTIMVSWIATNTLTANPRSPFGISVESKSFASGSLVRVSFDVPPDCVLYADRLHFLTPAGVELVPVSIPQPLLELDKASGEQKKVYDHSFAADLKRDDLADDCLIIKFQGCTNAACFFPEKRLFVLRTGGLFSEATNGLDSTMSSAIVAVDWTNEAKGFKITGRQTGYLKPSEFTAFLDRAVSGQGATDDPLFRFKNLGTFATLMIIILGGFLLNFTPCILPMIPINLAIIGAGSQARTRAEGFKNGSMYGLGMALAYGVLGVVVVLTGAKFGTLNSTVWFNLVVALVFLVMALGMFDVFNIDLSRFGGSFGIQNNSTHAGLFIHNFTVFAMGGMAALLAGACVAPVVISVMLLAASLYAKGMLAGLALPFLLGAGMALPWPFAGAGITALPKPGRWMKWIKYGFGGLIVCFGIYYGHLAYHAFALARSGKSSTALAEAPSVGSENASASQANKDLVSALQLAKTSHRSVFIDFHASWCKNCLAMDGTVFNQAEVQARLKDFIAVRYDAEQPNTSPTRELLDYFGVMGLPTYLVVKVNE